MTTMQARTRGLEQTHWRKIKYAPQRLVLCRLMIVIMRTVHSAYAPAGERFGTRLETFFIGLCVALGDIEGKPLSMAYCLYARAPHHRHTQARPAAALGSGRTQGSSLLHTREDAQFFSWHAQLPTGSTHSEQGD